MESKANQSPTVVQGFRAVIIRNLTQKLYIQILRLIKTTVEKLCSASETCFDAWDIVACGAVLFYIFYC